ncbi:bacillithiol biosynthesis cysteine-adding enzyme BshC [Ichthyenterobacterium magnum]|uniref:Putative cysteine ligase BshC n=1 Tax=Ichthyenterobacterium magnum TaxID=1230530 RepID=A0A420DV44_9FLAO|nr:bacillithiol biosynthesis cysteine-adding enzyme BshC [Ichthyenterobacterium magnum]RKE98049.1 bacillithiol biosynthesis cysteine-adding enzyme BshC [Ichthyenterobacterium magnum]
MPTDCIPYRDTQYFSSLICDYLDEKNNLKPFYNRFPKLENFKAQIEDKQTSFSKETRTILTKALKNQYKDVDISSETLQNIEAINSENTFTITTGHQLNLFTGPLYFFYKIVSTINLCKQLKEEFPNQNFVPVYWMATEDHDFEEINYFNFKGKKVQWNRHASGAVGELNLDGLEAVFEAYKSQLNSAANAEELKQLFKAAYLKHDNLTDAMQYLVNKLFKAYGLVIVDGNDSSLKRLFIPHIKDELLNHTSYTKVSQANNALSNLNDNYKIQVNPRKINLFYIAEGLRERIIKIDEVFKVNNTDIGWSKSELLKHLDKVPERFSPNVIMRPLYQEVILPNLCYIGGGGELAYWLQLRSNFEAQNVVFPMLLLRNSVVLITGKQKEKLQKLNVSIEDLFLKQFDLGTKITTTISEIDLDFSPQKEHLKSQFKTLYKLAEQTDKSFLGAVRAQEKKQIKGLENLEKRLLKAQKRKINNHLSRVNEIQNELFPGQSLQERNTNFSEFYLDHGKELIPKLIQNLEPLNAEFLVLEI